MIAKVQTNLPASAERAWHVLVRRNTLLYVTRGVLGFTDTNRWPEKFRQGGRTKTRLVLFHLVPAWKHEFDVVEVNEGKGELVLDGHGGFVRRWKHRITIEPESEGSCRYRDEVDIEAGFFTPLVWGLAHLLYRYRQMRWRRLLRAV